MPIRVDAYTAGGLATGLLARTGHLRDALETSDVLPLERVAWQPLGELTSQPAGDVQFLIDDVLVAVADDEPASPVHAQWHPIRLEVGPYVVEGELPTLPGYDPGRALARPTGEFVLLRDVRVTPADDPDRAVVVAAHALVNRYGAERVRSDIMLGFFFPGAALDGIDETGSGGAAPSVDLMPVGSPEPI